MSRSKQSELDECIRRGVREAVRELAFNEPRRAEFLREIARDLATTAAHNVVWDHYRWLEVTDIMGWRTRTTKGR